MSAKKTVQMPESKIPVLADADVVVCGGGPAGFAAAVAAARNGARTILLEKALFAGGMTTGGLLTSIIHMSDGQNIMAGGLCKEVVDIAASRMNIKPNYHWQNIHPEIMKSIYDEMLIKAEVKIFFGLQICAVSHKNGNISGVIVSTASGLKVVTGKIFVDGTGDGNIAAWAGAPFEIGDSEGITMAPTLCSMYCGVDYDAIPLEHRTNGLGRDEWAEHLNNGSAPLPEHHFVGFFRNGKNTGSGNLGHIYNVNCLDENDITKCCVEGRRQDAVFHDFFKKHVNGFQSSELCATASQLGVRETRRITGEYVLTVNDYFSKRHFDDDIGCLSYPIDIHAAGADPGKQQEVEKNIEDSRLKPGENYGIPFRALLPLNTKNLLVAGRCISTDRAMQASVRIVPGCFITGEAAGTAAAMVAGTGLPRKLDIVHLQQKLRNQRVFIP